MVCIIRNVAAAAAIALALPACGSDKAAESDATNSSSAGTSTSTEAATSAVAAVDDEQQIRDLVAAQMEAFSAGDWDALAELTCSEYREQARDPGAFMVPPIDPFGTRQQIATLSVPQVSERLAEQFGGGVPPATLDRVSQAIVDYDEPAYRAAMLDAVSESTSVTVDQVENIEITGDNATAVITSTRVMGDDAPQTNTGATPYVREDGVWLDCTDPTGAS